MNNDALDKSEQELFTVSFSFSDLPQLPSL